ncbi:hypothetical protein PR048_033079 [Dryococelus australis]|uniref:Uncharacterized protein n=1 Tax=Dryococelus australis TaxID=614101 RepID=A0ABQ9G3H4_9NEOP|nr:hypothetical protein PR048_033079 [Dryococelus australis]
MDDIDICMRQCSVIEFLNVEEAEGETQLADAVRSNQPATAATLLNIQHVDEIIRDDRWITTDELCHLLSIGKGTVMTIIEKLGYSKACACGVPKMLTDQNKEARKTIASNVCVGGGRG